MYSILYFILLIFISHSSLITLILIYLNIQIHKILKILSLSLSIFILLYFTKMFLYYYCHLFFLEISLFFLEISIFLSAFFWFLPTSAILLLALPSGDLLFSWWIITGYFFTMVTIVRF